MERKPTAEDDGVDSGAETGGSDYSPLSSASSGGEVSMVELQDPFLVSVHLISDPGQAQVLQRAADGVLRWLHPELRLFRVSERARALRRPRAKRHHGGGGGPAAACQPALAVILFLLEPGGGEEQTAALHRALRHPPWRYHHTEEVTDGRRPPPPAPCGQDFFTLAPGTPLWAVRRVHYGKEILRFTLYCRHDNYPDTVRLYRLLLQRRVSQKKEDFCFFVVYSNADVEIQLSFKRLPPGRNPLALESAVMEVRVRDVGALVPLLPHPCCPISDVRWRTEDYDGNKILLQVQSSRSGIRAGPSSSGQAPPPFARSSAPQRSRRSRPRVQRQTSLCSLPPAWEEREAPAERPRAPWRGRRSASLFSLRGPSSGAPCRLHAEETDVDTGRAVPPGGAADLTVVSAYARPPSAPPEVFRPRTTSASPGSRPPSINSSAAPSLSDVSVISGSLEAALEEDDEEDEGEDEEEEEEFYI